MHMGEEFTRRLRVGFFAALFGQRSRREGMRQGPGWRGFRRHVNGRAILCIGQR